MDLTCGRDLGHRVSILVDFDHLQEVCSSSNICLPNSVVDLICLPVRSVPGLSDRPIVDTRICSLEGTLNTRAYSSSGDVECVLECWN